MSTQPDSRRKFTIQSDFGSAREWRSRKSRPCDACRKRKTACVIKSTPPCLFCKTRGLPCESSGVVGQGWSSSSATTPGTTVGTSASPPTTTKLPERISSQSQGNSPAGLPATGLPRSNASPSSEMQGISPAPRHVAPLEPQHLPFNHKPGASPGASVALSAETTVVSPAPSSVPSSMGAPPPIRTLEDNKDKTSHSMGLAAEQDTMLLDSFRSVIMNGPEVDAEFVQVFPGSRETGKPPVHFCFIVDEFFVHDDKVKHDCSEAIEALVAPHGDALVRAYFKHVHVVLPIVSKGRFLRRYAEDRRQMPASLRGAIYALACLFWDQEPSLPGRRPYEQHEVADLALTSLQRELDSPNLDKLQASLLLLHLKPNDVDSVEHPRTWTQTAQAVACAQMIGLHQDPEQWSIPSWEKKLRKKLWWATFAADVWSSLCHGNPPHVYPSSYSTSQLTLEDLRFDEEVAPDLQRFIDQSDANSQLFTGARFLEHIKLAQLTREVLGNAFEVPQNKPAYRDPIFPQRALFDLKSNLTHWESMLPQCLAMSSQISTVACNNAPLHLSYYASQALIFRGLMSPATKAARSDPDSNLRRWFRIARTEFTNFTTYMTQINQADLNGFWGRHGRSQLILCGNFLIYLFLLALEMEDVQAAFRLIESFHESLARLETLADSTARLLIRPVALRMNSFFVQAPGLMRNPSGPDMSTPESSSA